MSTDTLAQTQQQSPNAVRMIRAIQSTVLFITLVVLAWPNAQAAGSSTSKDYSLELRTAKALVYKEKYKPAIKKLKSVTKAKPKNADAWNLLGYASRKTDQLEQAKKAYTEALALNPEHKGALEYQGELFIKLGDIGAAKSNLQKLETLCPTGCEELDQLRAALNQT